MRLQMEQSESDKVMRAGVDGRSSAMVEIVERNWQPVAAITNRLLALEPGTDPDRGVRQADLEEHLLAHEVLVRTAGNARNHIIQEAKTEIGVLIFFAR